MDDGALVADAARPVLCLWGVSITVYSICIAHVNDNIAQEELVAAASSLILVYGIGSIFGPFVASLLMERVGPEGLFLFAGAVQIGYAAFGTWRIT